MQKQKITTISKANVESKILIIREKKVMLDRDLAELYGVETKVLNQAVKRNIERFPEDFMFQLTKQEWDILRSQFVTLEAGKGKYPKYLPCVFTEQGVAMLSSVLRSKDAIQINILIMRAFVKIRHMIIGYDELKQKLSELEKKINKQFSVYNFLFDEAFGSINSLKKLPVSSDNSDGKIGFRDRKKEK